MPGSEAQNDSQYSNRRSRQLVDETELLLQDLGLENADLDNMLSNLGETALPLKSTFQLSTSKDLMSMYLSITPGTRSAEPVTTADIYEELSARGIERGILTDVILEAVADAEDGNEVKDRKIVAGRPPGHPGPPSIVFKGHTLGSELQTVDAEQLSKESRTPILCEAGDTIAEIHSGDQGIDGYTATGEILPHTPAPSPTLKPGSNVTAEAYRFIADSSGVVLLQNDTLEVARALFYKGDVGKRDSPINFDGSIVIKGSVRHGVEVTATDSIYIAKAVEDAVIRSTGGDVILNKGIAGRNSGVIEAANDVTCGFIENASVKAGRDITLQVGSINSHLTAGNNILAVNGRGSIVGGTLIAGHQIKVKAIGSDGANTIAISGVSTEHVARASEISRKIHKHEMYIDKIESTIAQYERLTRDISKLTPKEQQMYHDLHKLHVLTKHHLGEARSSRDQVLKDSVAGTDSSISILLTLGPGVEFFLGPARFEHKEVPGPLTLKYDAKKDRVIYRKVA